MNSVEKCLFGRYEWWANDQRHRTDGPAVIWEDGTYGWYVRGRNITDQVKLWLKANDTVYPWQSEEQQILFQLTWG